MRKVSTIHSFTGSTAFLNGTEGLHSIDEPVYKSFLKEGLKAEIIDNLFENSAKLKMLTLFENVVLFTTGLRPEKLERLREAFVSMNYVPKNVIFITEETAILFSSIARELQDKGTQFWQVDFFDHKTLYPIGWL